MNEDARKMINDRLERLFPEGVTTLYFSNRSGVNAFGERNPFNDQSELSEKIYTCLQLNKHSVSYSSYFETYAGANRSVIDVWRHIKHYYPDTTIFEVMSTVYNMIYETQQINTFICGDIGRRVLIIDKEDWYAHDSDEYDVFYITLDEWNNI